MNSNKPNERAHLNPLDIEVRYYDKRDVNEINPNSNGTVKSSLFSSYFGHQLTGCNEIYELPDGGGKLKN